RFSYVPSTSHRISIKSRNFVIHMHCRSRPPFCQIQNRLWMVHHPQAIKLCFNVSIFDRKLQSRKSDGASIAHMCSHPNDGQRERSQSDPRRLNPVPGNLDFYMGGAPEIVRLNSRVMERGGAAPLAVVSGTNPGHTSLVLANS